jgi:hypothetical protein
MATPAAEETLTGAGGDRDNAEIIEETMENFAGESEEPVVEIAPQEDVYSYMMFIGPTESVKSGGRMNVDTAVGAFLVIVTIFIQGYFLWAVFNSVITGNVKWEAGIVQTGQGNWNLVGEVGEGCNTGKSLCTLEDVGLPEKHYSCAPPSVRLTGRWEELDTDGDGVWTREEVMAAREKLQCKYVVDPVEFFDVINKFVINREKIIWVHPDIRKGAQIAKPYFTYASGDIIMCGYRNEKMCANLIKNGFFDAPLEFSTVPRVGNTIDTAMFYCRELLKPGGTCEKVLPSTYSVWKVESDQECQGKKYQKFVYQHPTSGVKRSFLSVDYKARLQYKKTLTPLFIVYKTFIILIWVMAMVVEFKGMVNIAMWLYGMPSAKSASDEGKAPVELDQDTDEYTINGITDTHRATQCVVFLIRLFMTIILFWVGTSLLLQSPEYMSLLFDAVSLKFIIELQELFYMNILRQRVKDQTSKVTPMTAPMIGPSTWSTHPGIKDFCWFLLVLGTALFCMWQYYRFTVAPLGEALECTCLGVGEKCVEAQKFTYQFWYDYWKYATPQVFKDVAVFKKELQGGFLEEQVFQNMTSASIADVPVSALMRTSDGPLKRMIERHHSMMTRQSMVPA